MVRCSVIENSHVRSRHNISECDVTRRIHLGGNSKFENFNSSDHGVTQLYKVVCKVVSCYYCIIKWQLPYSWEMRLKWTFVC